MDQKKLPVNKRFGILANKQQLHRATQSLKANNIEVLVLEDGQQAKEKVLEMIPEGSEVFTMSSVTLDTIGLADEINNSPKYTSVRVKLTSMDRKTQGREMRKLGAAPDFTIGSVHSVTEDGHLLIASNSGSQLGSYVFGGGKVIFIIGAQKIVKDEAEGLKRIYQYSFPLEDQRAQKVYGMGSGVNKILIINKEIQPDRITAIIVKEKLGF